MLMLAWQYSRVTQPGLCFWGCMQLKCRQSNAGSSSAWLFSPAANLRRQISLSAITPSAGPARLYRHPQQHDAPRLASLQTSPSSRFWQLGGLGTQGWQKLLRTQPWAPGASNERRSASLSARLRLASPSLAAGRAPGTRVRCRLSWQRAGLHKHQENSSAREHAAVTHRGTGGLRPSQCP